MKMVSVITTAVLFFAHTGALANSDSQRLQALYSLPLEQLLQIPVRSSTLTTKELKTVPSAVTIFGREQIRNLGADYLHELINYVPGFQAFRQGESSIEYFHSSRGHRSSTKSREVLILVDGVRFNREFDNAITVPMLALHNVEKVEFIRGPGSALYGSNAVLGVIDITTVKRENQARFAVGENAVRSLAGTGSKSLANWQLDVGLNAFDEGGETYIVEDYYSANLIEVGDPRSGEDLQVSLQQNRTQFDVSFYNREAEDFYIAERTSPDTNFVKHEYKHYRFAQGFSWTETLESDFSLMQSQSVFDTRGNRGPLGEVKSLVEEKNYDLKIHNQWAWAKGQNLIVGLEYRFSDISEFSYDTENQGLILFYPESERKISSTYIQNEYQIASNLEFTLGARYDYYDEIGSSFSPRLGLVKQLNETHALKALYGEAFRAPTVNELLLDNTLGGLLGNPDLQAETIKTWELIWIASYQNQVLSINAFYNTFENIISRDETLALPTFANQSTPESFHGFELEYTLQFLPRWLMHFNASNFHNLPEADFREAENLASLAINYSHGNWNLNLSGAYSGERHFLVDDNMQTLGDYWLVNTRWRYRFNENFKLYLAGKNLLNEDYLTPPQRSVFSMPMQNRGRELTVGLEIQY